MKLRWRSFTWKFSKSQSSHILENRVSKSIAALHCCCDVLAFILPNCSANVGNVGDKSSIAVEVNETEVEELHMEIF